MAVEYDRRGDCVLRNQIGSTKLIACRKGTRLDPNNCCMETDPLVIDDCATTAKHDNQNELYGASANHSSYPKEDHA